jgi:hypothetical protein
LVLSVYNSLETHGCHSLFSLVGRATVTPLNKCFLHERKKVKTVTGFAK